MAPLQTGVISWNKLLKFDGEYFVSGNSPPTYAASTDLINWTTVTAPPGSLPAGAFITGMAFGMDSSNVPTCLSTFSVGGGGGGIIFSKGNDNPTVMTSAQVQAKILGPTGTPLPGYNSTYISCEYVRSIGCFIVGCGSGRIFYTDPGNYYVPIPGGDNSIQVFSFDTTRSMGPIVGVGSTIGQATFPIITIPLSSTGVPLQINPASILSPGAQNFALTNVKFISGMYIAVGYNGVILKSTLTIPDMLSPWDLVATPNPNINFMTLSVRSQGNNMTIVAGGMGVGNSADQFVNMVASTNGTTWKYLPTLDNAAVYGASLYDPETDLFVAVGNTPQSAILYSNLSFMSDASVWNMYPAYGPSPYATPAKKNFLPAVKWSSQTIRTAPTPKMWNPFSKLRAPYAPPPPPPPSPPPAPPVITSTYKEYDDDGMNWGMIIVLLVVLYMVMKKTK
jgi:hypothetical protein